MQFIEPQLLPHSIFSYTCSRVVVQVMSAIVSTIHILCMHVHNESYTELPFYVCSCYVASCLHRTAFHVDVLRQVLWAEID